MIPRTLFTPEHETFRDSVRRFMQQEVAPHDERWQEQGYVDKDVWKKAGANGFLCCTMPEEYGGSGADKLYSVVLMEEQARANNSSLGWGLHSEIVAPYLFNYGTGSAEEEIPAENGRRRDDRRDRDERAGRRALTCRA
jgi:acyl-CoA dehydrogenase